jgi:hypothetical protein
MKIAFRQSCSLFTTTEPRVLITTNPSFFFIQTTQENLRRKEEY